MSCDDSERRIVRRAVADKRATIRRANHGEPGGRGTCTAFTAAGQVNDERVAKMRRRDFCNLRSHRTGCDMGGCADRRAGASHNMPARIVGAHDEAEPLRRTDEGGCGRDSESYHHQRAARRGTHAACSRRSGGVSEVFKRLRTGVAECKPNAAS